MPLRKQARINPAGRIVDADRQVHVSQEDGGGDSNRVEFRHVGTGTPAGGYTIDFSSCPLGSPFGTAAGDVRFNVARGQAEERRVSRDALPGVYKYSVLDSANVVTDDPDVIVD